LRSEPGRVPGSLNIMMGSMMGSRGPEPQESGFSSQNPTGKAYSSLVTPRAPLAYFVWVEERLGRKAPGRGAGFLNKVEPLGDAPVGRGSTADQLIDRQAPGVPQPCMSLRFQGWGVWRASSGAQPWRGGV
jgi:hypothetical protein